MTAPTFITAAEAAERVGVHSNTIRRWLETGRAKGQLVKVSGRTMWLVDPASLDGAPVGGMDAKAFGSVRKPSEAAKAAGFGRKRPEKATRWESVDEKIKAAQAGKIKALVVGIDGEPKGEMRWQKKTRK